MKIKTLFNASVALVLLLAGTITSQAAPLASPLASPASVIAWNTIAQRSAIQVGKQFQAQSMISIAATQAAVYNAVVAIEGGYEPYGLSLPRQRGASTDAAIAAAAHDTLAHSFPAQQSALDADYVSALAAIPDGAAKTAGVAVGQEAAAGIIMLRQNDGNGLDIGYSMPAPAPGVWQLPAEQTPQTPWVAYMRPFLLESPDQFRPGPPPALTSRTWAADFNEVKELGSADGVTRSTAQTEVAKFWSSNAVSQYNSAFQHLTIMRGLNAMEAARLFAMGNLIGSDALIACFDAKYHYEFWRPQFAIPQGDLDGNAATSGNAVWKPLLATPNHPEYPAAHGCLTSAEAEMLAAFFGTNRIDLELTSTVTTTTRHYVRVTDLVREIIDARVWGGVHYRTSAVAGTVLGRKVAHWTLARYFQPAP